MKSYALLFSLGLFFSICCWANGCAGKITADGGDKKPASDDEGNIINADQIWMVENLNVSNFKNGDPIPEVKTTEEWVRAGKEEKPAWCYYQNDPEKGKIFGKLYNWYAVIDPRGLTPEGWRVPSIKEWKILIDTLGGSKVAGTKMKAATGWGSSGNGDNSSKFKGLPGGGRTYKGDFSDIDTAGIWWSSTENSAITAWGYNLLSNESGIYQGSFNKTTGLSVRALKVTSSKTDPTSRQTLGEKLQNVLDVSLASGNGVGISAAVILPNGETWIGAGGVSYGTTKITKDMRFSVGSIEKMFTAATIMQLAEEGKLKLDDPLDKWLPTYPYIDPKITVRQLLNHTGGLYDIVDNPDLWDAMFREPAKFWNLEGIILAFNREPVFPKGAGWNYSQVGYNLLQMIIEKITGLEKTAHNRNRFFVPLGLSNTFTSKGETLPVNIAHGWFDTDKDLEYEDLSSWPRIPFASGIGGEVWSTPEDLAKWARALFYDKRVVSQASLDQMLTFHSPCTGEEFICAGYGLGVMKFNSQLLNSLEVYGHGGHGPGYAAGCMYLPDYHVCIGIMENTDGGESIGMCMTNLIKVIIDYLEKNR